ncbi:MAG: response regulator [Treponema sp.]|jgi:signal transduction histidine kinase/DNA-binding response OmpR family regulator|nr:response regulator [Treponema sp.]
MAKDEDPARQIEVLKKENTKLARQLERARDDLNKARAMTAAQTNLFSARIAVQQRQENYMSMLLGSSPDIIILFDGAGRFAYCTDVFLKIAGIPNFELINGKHFREVFERFAKNDVSVQAAGSEAAAWTGAAGIPTWLDQIDWLFANMNYAEAGIGANSLEEILDISGGNPRKYQIHFTPMQGDSGAVEGAVMIFHDVTDIENAKNEAEKAREAAERASLVKSEFLANMSHEIRTPMNAIIGMTNIARTSNNVDKIQYCIGKINDASEHLLGVINDILDMSKIEANKLELSYSEFNFDKMLIKMANVINFRIEEKRQIFNARVDKDIPAAIVCDEQRLSQVIANLLSNAVKFTPEGGTVILQAQLKSLEDLKQRLQDDSLPELAPSECIIQIEVSDTGIGLKSEQKALLFHSFQQADSGISRKFGGTGLGLAISKRIVEMMGGTIWVDSEFGKGSTFAFIIRVKQGEKASKRSLLQAGISWDNLRILAVDDVPEILEYFNELSDQFGVYCDIASSASEALRLVNERGGYDIYFVDWKMPGMDGIELAREIGKIKSAGASALDKSATIILISAQDWNTVEKEAREAGIKKFIQKPLFASVIADTINECLGVEESLPVDAKTEDHADYTGHKILLAEDIEINREIVLTVLEPSGLEIVCAENGRIALEKYSADPAGFDMIFMDIHMPEMDGYEATRRIRALDADPAKTVPIIAMTANVFKEDIEKCLAVGMDDHIGKPLDFMEVMKMLKRFLG